MSSVSITNTTHGPVPRLPFEKIARAALGIHYELSLVICGDRLAQRMNRTYRNKTYTPNVLSFSLSATEGEMFLNVRAAEREAKKYGIPFREHVTLLFVHGVVHLKGLRHGRTMEDMERRMVRMFNIQWHGAFTRA